VRPPCYTVLYCYCLLCCTIFVADHEQCSNVLYTTVYSTLLLDPLMFLRLVETL